MVRVKSTFSLLVKSVDLSPVEGVKLLETTSPTFKVFPAAGLVPGGPANGSTLLVNLSRLRCHSCSLLGTRSAFLSLRFRSTA